MSDEAGECRIDHRSPRLPAHDYGFFAVVQTLGSNSIEIGKGILVAANKGEEITPQGEVDVMSTGKSEDVGETLYCDLARFEELDGVGAPITLGLDRWTCFKANNRFFLGIGTHNAQPIPEDTDTAAIAGFGEFFESPLTGDVGIFFQ